jgi:hypothetical protein
MAKQVITKSDPTEFLLYTAPYGKVKVEIIFHNENIWLTQKRMAELFGVQVHAISKHLKNIFGSKELEASSVISILETTAEDGKEYKILQSRCHYFSWVQGKFCPGNQVQDLGY